MIGNYLMTCVRLLRRERGYAAINTIGLAVGLGVCLVIGQFVAYQLGFDSFHEKGDRIYRVLRSRVDGAGDVSAEQTAPLGPTLVAALPEVEAAVRFHGGPWEHLMRASGAEQGAYERGLLSVDANVFGVFSFDMLRGDPATALVRPYTVVLTPSLARRLFGEEDPSGKVIRIDERHDYEVTGIVEEPPANSTLQFSALASFATQYEQQRTMMVEVGGGWNMTAFPSYLQLAKGSDPRRVEQQISVAIAGVTDSPGERAKVYKLQPLSAVYLDTTAPNRLGPSSDPRYVFLCATVAVLILVIAAVNYVNLATARARRRAREIGVRKSLGAHRGQLMRQLLGESVLLCAAATALAGVLAEVAIPLFPSLVGIVVPELNWTVLLWVQAAALASLLGLAAGAYPAWVVSRFQPAAMAGHGDAIGGARLRRGLVVVQFTVTAALMTITLVVWQQLDYIQTRRLGLDLERVVVIENRALEPQQAQTLKAELLQDSRVASVSLARQVPSGFLARMTVTPEGSEEQVWMTSYGVDGGFVETLGMRMVQGRALSDELTTDATAIVINEAAARELEWDQPVGKGIYFNTVNYRVVGVVMDFHYESLHRPVEPLYMVLFEGWAGSIAVRVRAGHVDEALSAIDAKWSTFAPHHPIQRHFLDTAFERLYDQERRLARVFTVFFSLAIAVASIGLFGLAAHAAQERTREIGIRKVFGASVAGITAMLSRDFARLVAVAFGLSVPIAWWTVSQWLQDFAYHVDIGVGVFLLSGAAALGVALLTVSQQSIRAGLANPVDTLRHE